MPVFHIHIQGCVQGVGFRPFVARLAAKHCLNGYVSNTTHGVHIEIEGEDKPVMNFYQECIKNAPPQSDIYKHEIKEIVTSAAYSSFTIQQSSDDQNVQLAITPDFGVCQDCINDLNTQKNKRHDYLFTTCTNCGPRYSIIKSLPFDRENTTVTEFPMCSSCIEEYGDAADRRFYSQTNTCKACGIKIKMEDKTGNVITDQEEIVEKAVTVLRSGAILAVKGAGGYLLMCDASSKPVVAKLRQRKSRPYKPLAVLYPNIDRVEKDFTLSARQKKNLVGPERPVVLLSSKSLQTPLATDEIAPALNNIGVMLPSTPLLYKIVNDFSQPLIATSGNLSGSPIIHRDSIDLHKELFSYADFIISHNLEISMPQDDSVIRFTNGKNKKIILRRSRGIAPNYFKNTETLSENILALGGHMKGSFALSNDNYFYVSQYLGNLSDYDTQENYKNVLSRFLEMVRIRPSAIMIDSHPEYFSSLFGEELAEKWKVPLHKVQHHEAHFVSVLAENNLLNSKERILGVIWDGTGYGNDGTIQGGEFFTYKSNQISRISHFDYFPHLSNDKMAFDNRLPAFSLTYDLENGDLMSHFSENEWQYFHKWVKNPALLTSSMGRVFDGLAFLLGLNAENTYEGQAAMKLELEAEKFLEENKSLPKPYSFEHGKSVSLKTMFTQVLDDIKKGNTSGFISYKFHITLVEIIKKMAVTSHCSKLAFSGGVFQNGLLVDLILEKLDDSFDLYFHKQLSPNDEGISFGQLMYHQILQKNKEKMINKENRALCV